MLFYKSYDVPETYYYIHYSYTWYSYVVIGYGVLVNALMSFADTTTARALPQSSAFTMVQKKTNFPEYEIMIIEASILGIPNAKSSITEIIRSSVIYI